jgi:hypothetical protein
LQATGRRTAFPLRTKNRQQTKKHDLTGKAPYRFESSLSSGESGATAIRAEASAVKGGGNLFALYRWKRERQQIIVGGGGRGALQSAARIGFSNQILREIKSLRHLRQLKSAPS